MDQNLCTPNDIKDFDALPFDHKIIFSRYDNGLKSNEYMPEFKDKEAVGDPYIKGHIFYKHLISHFQE